LGPQCRWTESGGAGLGSDHPPGDRPADDPIIDFPKVDLLDADRDGTYEASYSGFTSVGTYQVMVYAKDEDGAISLPKEIAVSQIDADSYEDDDGDGYSNLEEYRGGSDPTDRNSLPKPKPMPWIPLLLFEKE
jgi:hypothetical protein